MTQQPTKKARRSKPRNKAVVTTHYFVLTENTTSWRQTVIVSLKGGIVRKAATSEEATIYDVGMEVKLPQYRTKKPFVSNMTYQGPRKISVQEFVEAVKEMAGRHISLTQGQVEACITQLVKNMWVEHTEKFTWPE